MSEYGQTNTESIIRERNTFFSQSVDTMGDSEDLKRLVWLNMARLDFKNQGAGNDLKVSVVNGNHYKVTKPQWFSQGGAGYVLETSDKHQVIELECYGKGNLMIRLQGIDRRALDGTRLPLWVDYTRLVVNDEVIFWELKQQWHDKPCIFNKLVNDGERIKVEISWSYHGYKGEELARLIYLWCVKPKSAN